MKYRSEIDGLRALAVFPVILFHAGFKLFNGGYVGVDIFFVISGYLITSILIEDMENNNFSLIYFYERRTRRILPALFLIMFICVPFSFSLMLPTQIQDFSECLVAVSLFVSNIFFWFGSGYFASEAIEKPLLHTWSLAVEEQFYFLFPLFLLIAWRFGKNIVFWMIVIIALSSLVLSEWGWRNSPTANFYLTPTRAWELLAGSISAFVVQKRGVKKNNVLAMIGLASIFLAIFAYDESTPFPSVFALVPVFGVVLILLFADQKTLVAKILSTKILVSIGLISYSAYLWHQPLFAFSTIYTINQVSLPVTFSLLLLTFFLAFFTYKYVEQPFRAKTFSRNFIFIMSFVSLISLSLLGITLKNVKVASYKETDFEKYVKAQGDWLYPNNLKKTEVRDAYKYDLKQSADLLFFGDSHAEQFGPLVASFKSKKINVAFLTGGGCPPIPNVLEDLHPHCNNLFDRFDRMLTKNQKIKTIVIAGCYNCYFIYESSKINFHQNNSYYNYYYLDGQKKLFYRDGKGINESVKSLEKFVNKLAHKYDVIFLGDNPYNINFDPKVMMQEKIANNYYFKKKYPDYSKPNFNVSKIELKINKMLMSSFKNNIKFINLSDFICPNGVCSSINKHGSPVYKDTNHMRPDFVKQKFGDLSVFLE